jgi:ParB family chromosome partitioning protein
MAQEIDSTNDASNPTPNTTARPRPGSIIVPIADIRADPRNRKIQEDDDLTALIDSIRKMGILTPLLVRPIGEGDYEIIDGERRWRAALNVGLTELPCEVRQEASDGGAALVNVVANEQRTAAGCVHTARRLRHIRNDLGLTHEQVAFHTGLPLDRVKTYAAILGVSDHLLRFFEERDVPVKVAAELARYERSTNEARSKLLVSQYLKTPMSCEEIAARRKRIELARKKDHEGNPATKPTRTPSDARLLEQLESLLLRHQGEPIPGLADVLARFGFEPARKEAASC